MHRYPVLAANARVEPALARRIAVQPDAVIVLVR